MHISKNLKAEIKILKNDINNSTEANSGQIQKKLFQIKELERKNGLYGLLWIIITLPIAAIIAMFLVYSNFFI